MNLQRLVAQIIDRAFGRFHINLWLKRGRVEVRNPRSRAARSLAAGGTPIYTRDLHVLCSVLLCCRAGSTTRSLTLCFNKARRFVNS